jgi:hypothetical protein
MKKTDERKPPPKSITLDQLARVRGGASGFKLEISGITGDSKTIVGG